MADEGREGEAEDGDETEELARVVEAEKMESVGESRVGG